MELPERFPTRVLAVFKLRDRFAELGYDGAAFIAYGPAC